MVRLPEGSQTGKPIIHKSMQIKVNQSYPTEVTHYRKRTWRSRIMSLEVQMNIAGVHIEQEHISIGFEA